MLQFGSFTEDMCHIFQEQVEEEKPKKFDNNKFDKVRLLGNKTVCKWWRGTTYNEYPLLIFMDQSYTYVFYEWVGGGRSTPPPNYSIMFEFLFKSIILFYCHFPQLAEILLKVASITITLTPTAGVIEYKYKTVDLLCDGIFSKSFGMFGIAKNFVILFTFLQGLKNCKCYSENVLFVFFTSRKKPNIKG